jgi:hypothetical protein
LVSEARQHLGRMATPYSAVVFTHGYIPYVVEFIFDMPVLSSDTQESFGRGLATPQAGNRTDHFPRGYSFVRALALQSTDLLDTGPINIRRKLVQCFDLAKLYTVAVLVQTFGHAYLRFASHFLLRGKQAGQTHPECSAGASVGSL